jgi:hypothetical protein
MTENYPKGDGEKGFSAFSGLVSDVSKDIERSSRHESPANEVMANQVKETSRPKISTGKLIVVVIVAAYPIAWSGGALIGWAGNLFNNYQILSSQSEFKPENGKPIEDVGFSDNSNFDVTAARSSGRSDSEIAEHLAKLSHFDLSGARREGYTDQQIINHLTSRQTVREVESKHTIISHDTPVVSIIDPIAKAPNGQNWPAKSGYLRGYKKLNTGGLSSLTIDNTSNDSNVYLKLYSLNQPSPVAVRHVFIKAGDKFIFSSVRAGNYDVRYRDLNNGGISKSEGFELREIHEEDGTRYSKMTLTLYKVQNGNMQMQNITEADF